MEKKIWIILFLVVTLAIVGVFLNSQNDPVRQNEEVSEDIISVVERSLSEAYNLFYEMEEELSKEEVEENLSRYNNLQLKFFTLDDRYFENKITEEEFNREMETLHEDIEEFTQNLDSLYKEDYAE